MMRPTAAELKKIRPILNNRFGGKDPNIYYAIYKNRGGKYVNVKVWLYVDYGTMRVSDLFCTDYDNKLIDKAFLPETFISVNEDQEVVFSHHKEDVPISNGITADTSAYVEESKLSKPTQYEAIYASEEGGADQAEKAIKSAMKTGEVQSVVSRKLQNRLDLEKEAEENMYSKTNGVANIDDEGWPEERFSEIEEEEEDSPDE